MARYAGHLRLGLNGRTSPIEQRLTLETADGRSPLDVLSMEGFSSTLELQRVDGYVRVVFGELLCKG